MPAASNRPVVGVGLVGLGNSGYFYHAEGTLEPSELFDLRGVADADAQRVRQGAQRFACQGYRSWEELVAAADVDVVVVALPHHLHAPVTLGALSAGKHVVVEKPMARTSAEADEMIRAAQDHGVLLTVFHQRRWDPDFREIKRAVTDGRIGEVWNIQERRSARGKYQVRGEAEPHVGGDVADWAHEEGKGGGAAFLAGPHLVDHVLHLAGRPPQAVSARIHRYPDDKAEHYLHLHLDFGGGLLAQIEVFQQVATPAPKWAVHGTEGSIVSQTGRSVEVRRLDGAVDLVEDLPALRHCDDFYDNLYAAITTGEPLAVTAEQGRDVVKVLELALQSARAGGQPLAL